MMSRGLLVLLVLLICLPSGAFALQVSEATITTQISDRAPVDAIKTYPATVERLYCFTRITGAIADTSIVHVWYLNGVEMARIELPVRSGNWRTWSVKTIFPGSAGDWKVNVLDGEGALLKSVSFVLTE